MKPALFFLGPLSPASLTGFEFGGMAALSDPQSWKRGSSMTQMQQLPQLPESVEELSENVSEGHIIHDASQTFHQDLAEEIQPSQDDEDLKSELSFTSAYSSPRDSTDMLQHMETTV